MCMNMYWMKGARGKCQLSLVPAKPQGNVDEPRYMY